MLKFSHSRLHTFLQCRRKYCYQYIDKLPRKDWDHFTVGSQIHLLLERLYKLKKRCPSVDTNTLVQHILTRASRTIYASRLDLTQHAELTLMFKNYVASHHHTLQGSYEVEKPFNFSLSKDITIEGFIDRVDFSPVDGSLKIIDNTFEVIDYKTTKQAKYLKDSLQLAIYAIAAKERYGYDKDIIASYVMLRSGSKKISHCYSNEELTKVKAQLLDIITQIQNEIVWAGNVTNLCSWCDFEFVCKDHNEWA